MGDTHIKCGPICSLGDKCARFDPETKTPAGRTYIDQPDAILCDKFIPLPGGNPLEPASRDWYE